MSRRKLTSWAAKLGIALGLALMTSNLVGLGVDYRIPAWAKHPAASRDAGRALTESLLQRKGERDQAYFRRLARDIKLRIAYGWSYTDARVSLTDNWLLHLAGFVTRTYRQYEFVDPDRALHRGYGICSQEANIAFGKLQDSGFKPRNVLLPHHTFVAVKDRSGREVVIDPSYGVVVPHSPDSIRRNPALVVPVYARLEVSELPPGSRTGKALLKDMKRVYADVPAAVNVGRATPQTALVEPWAYRAKWAIPVAMLLLGATYLLSPVRRLLRRTLPAARPSVIEVPVRPTA